MVPTKLKTASLFLLGAASGSYRRGRDLICLLEPTFSLNPGD